MRILMAVPMYPFPVIGGLERQAHELAKALVQRGHMIHVISSRFDAGQQFVERVDGVLVHRVQWIQSRLARFLWFPFRLTLILFKLKSEVDVVHVHNISWLGAFITLFARAMRLPVITKLPNTGEFGIAGMRHGPFGFLRVALLMKSDAIIAMTPESVDELAHIGYSSQRIFKITNGISLLTSRVETEQSNSLGAVTAVFVGRLSQEKGLVDLLHAWSTVKASSVRRVTLRIIGEGPQNAELKALAEMLDLGEVVEFVGYCKDVSMELAKSDLFVLPSYAEGNSNAILEAMRAGLPVVATRVGGSSIQVGPEGDRFLVPPGNHQALAAALYELIEDKALRCRVGEAMRARIERYFKIERIARTYEEAYDLLVSSRHMEICRLNSGLFG